MMKKVVILIFAVFSFIKLSTSYHYDTDCYKTYLETSAFNQSDNCQEMFEDHVKTYYDALNEIINSDDNETCIRAIFLIIRTIR